MQCALRARSSARRRSVAASASSVLRRVAPVATSRARSLPTSALIFFALRARAACAALLLDFGVDVLGGGGLRGDVMQRDRE